MELINVGDIKIDVIYKDNELPRRKQRGINALPLKEGKLICFV